MHDLYSRSGPGYSLFINTPRLPVKTETPWSGGEYSTSSGEFPHSLDRTYSHPYHSLGGSGQYLNIKNTISDIFNFEPIFVYIHPFLRLIKRKISSFFCFSIFSLCFLIYKFWNFQMEKTGITPSVGKKFTRFN